MMKNLIAFAFSAFLLSCAGAPKTEEKSFIDENIDFARAQIGNEIGVIEASGKCLNPVTLKTDSSVYYCGYADWRSGFFPGSVWYLYELTGDSTLLPLAAKYTDAIEEAKNLTWHHDIGFIVNCSFGNGLRLAGTPSYKDVMVQAAKWKAKHVVLIGLDGWGAYSVNKAEMPNVKKLMEEGSYTLKKRSVLPSSSAVNWASMYMGAGPELHGYTEWGSQTPELPSRVVNKHGIFPTVFSLLRESDPKAEIGCICEWAGIRYVVDTLALSYDKNITEKPQNPATAKCAVEYIKRARPALVNIVFDEPDHVGHAEGHDTPAYYEKLKELDGYIGQIIQAVKDAGMLDETIFIVTADHGGIKKGHGGKTMEEMETAFIIAGKGIKKGYEFQESMMQFDCASTIAYIFGLKQPQVWIGRPMIQVFK